MDHEVLNLLAARVAHTAPLEPAGIRLRHRGVRIDGRPDTPTYLRSAASLHTANTVPLGVLIGLLDQPGGLRVGVDIVNDGSRVQPGSGYPPLYSTLLADRAAAGARTTRLIVRLDLNESVAGLAYRTSIGTQVPLCR